MAQRPHGLVRAGTDPDVITMICTAGHVDHGKTSLVKLLTGCNTDRLKAEKERGLTIEVGFAPCYLGDNLSCGIADVPGHEKFVRTMVAGVSGIDLGLLVIAADDGVMPQTMEHLRIMELLGVREGMTALTKIDLVDETRLAEVEEEITDFLKGSFLEGTPICPISSQTGDGFFPFYTTLTQKITQLRQERGMGLFRMPIDRVFVNENTGTIITGIPVTGTISCGDKVETVPGNAVGRVKGIEKFGRKTELGSTGQCLALQLPDLSKTPPVRGDVLTLPGILKARKRVDVKINLLADLDPPLRHQEQVKFHIGRSETHAKVYTFDGKPLHGGSVGFAMIFLEEAVGAACHDRFILRRPSPAMTIAGGEILSLPTAAQQRNKKDTFTRLKAKAAFLGDTNPNSRAGTNKRIDWYLQQECGGDSTINDLCLALLLPQNEATAILDEFSKAGVVLRLNDETCVHRDCLADFINKMQAKIESSKKENILSLDISDLRKQLGCSQILWNRIEKELTGDGKAKVKDGKLTIKDAAMDLPPEERALREKILALYQKSGWASPRPEELPEMLGQNPAQVKRIFEPLCHGGELIRLSKNVVIIYEQFKRAQDEVVETIERDGFLDSSQFKHVIGSTRKYALAMLDFLDTRHITMRVQHNNRKLTSDYRKRLL